jgi:hypothetical protein
MSTTPTLQIGGSETERVFIGTDWSKPFKVADYDTDPTGATAKDITGWALTFDIRDSRTSPTAILAKTVSNGITIAGTFNSVFSTSTQLATLAIADTDITTALFGRNGGTFYYSLKRTDDGSETILAEGRIVIERATQT